jgi:hypothetical protein
MGGSLSFGPGAPEKAEKSSAGIRRPRAPFVFPENLDGLFL